MANYVSNNIRVIGNEKVQEKLNEYLETLESSDNYSDTGHFAKTFYKNPDLSDGGGTMNAWAAENIGAKWAYFEHIIDDNEFQVTSAWHPIHEFVQHLYNIFVELDPDVVIENRFEDESYDPVGGMVAAKGKFMSMEDNDFEYPDEDEMDEDDDYDLLMEQFYESIYDEQQDMILLCHEHINEGRGEDISYREIEVETEIE